MIGRRNILVFLVFCNFLTVFACCSALITHNNATSLQYTSIYSFGDSLTDTGNFLRTGALFFPVIAKLPYGVTFFKRATGRCTDGRLVLDFITEAFNLPYLPPYLSLPSGQTSSHGVNFAVAGATALDPKFFTDRQLAAVMWTKDSLNVQLDWFKNYKSSLCKTRKDCEDHFKKSLFIVGEIGGNDYNYASFIHNDISKLKAFTPHIIGAISGAIDALIVEGAKAVLVPGNLPAGCVAVYLTLFQSPNKADYDKHGCLIAYNAFAKYHNLQLQSALDKLRAKHPGVKIMYADNYGAALQFYRKPKHHGFSNGVLVACCGGGGPYNFNNSARCGHVGSKACTDPSTYANWDGIHLTEAAYKYIANGLLRGGYTSPSLI